MGREFCDTEKRTRRKSACPLSYIPEKAGQKMSLTAASAMAVACMMFFGVTLSPITKN